MENYAFLDKTVMVEICTEMVFMEICSDLDLHRYYYVHCDIVRLLESQQNSRISIGNSELIPES